MEESYLFWDWGDQNWSKIILICHLPSAFCLMYEHYTENERLSLGFEVFEGEIDDVDL
jgi:hypothetical protein